MFLDPTLPFPARSGWALSAPVVRRAVAVLMAGVTCAACREPSSVTFDPARSVHGAFDGAKAMAHVEALVGFGPRPAGTEALEASRRYIEAALAEQGWVVDRQVFTDNTPDGPIEFVNLRARFAPEGVDPWKRPVRALLASHYETKRYRTIRFVGANDGGSSTGLLLEAARVLAARPEAARLVELVFFDGEEAFVQFTPTDGLYGSRHYAGELRRWDPAQRPEFAIVFDLVGDRRLNVRVPPDCDPAMVGWLYETADALGWRDYFGASRTAIIDDHVPLRGVGVRVLNLIDLDYAAWHTAADTLDKLSADSLAIVGRTGLLLLEKHLLPAEGR